MTRRSWIFLRRQFAAIVRAVLAVVFAVGLIVAASRNLMASEILDQEFFPSPATLEAHNGDLYRAQVFTVGVTGQLTRVEAYMGGIGSSVFEIWDTVISEPFPIAPTPLASGTLSFSTGSTAIRDFEELDLSSANLQVQAGDRLALVQIGGSSTGFGSWWGNSGGGYAGGAAHTTLTTSPSGAWAEQSWDFGFRTYIDAIPEPSTAMMVLGCVTGTWGLRRRRDELRTFARG